VNPYVQFGIAMCVVVGLSLAGTAWLAAHFNKKAKADLKERLEPLAAVIGGEADVEEATVKGRWEGALAFGRVANAPGGFGRLFHAELVDAAGGSRWEWSNLPDKKQPEPTRTFEGDPDLERRLGLDWDALAEVVPNAKRQRWGWIYDPEAGMVRLSREMRTRLDIPAPEEFAAQLRTLAAIGAANRRAQGAPDAPPRVVGGPTGEAGDAVRDAAERPDA
jgi:hypothetical protein